MNKRKEKEAIPVWIVFYNKESEILVSVWISEDLANEHLNRLSDLDINATVHSTFIRGSQGYALKLD